MDVLTYIDTDDISRLDVVTVKLAVDLLSPFGKVVLGETMLGSN